MASAYGMPIVVDDGSSDDTGTVAERAGAVVVRHERNLGYDAALNSGVKKAFESGYRYAITLDADGQHDPQIVSQFIQKFEQGSQLVIGRRSKMARIAESIFGSYTARVYGIEDPLCGMKGYCWKLYESLGYVDSFNSIGTELALYGAKKGVRISQVNVEVREREGQPRFGSGISANLKILRAMLLGIFKRY